MSNTLNTITIKQLSRNGFKYASAYKDKLIITDRLGYLELFKYPCRLDAISILVCVNGKIDCNINLKKYTIEKNTIVICRNSDILQIISTQDIKAYAGLVSTDFINELKINFWQQNIHFSINPIIKNLNSNDLELINNYYNLFCSNIKTQRIETENIIKSLIQAFVYTIYSLVNGNELINKEHKPTHSEILLDKFLALVSKHHYTERKLSFYAEKMFLTSNYLSGEIKKISGKTAMDWINDYVIIEAKTMLKYSDLNIQEIAYQLNFASQSLFGKYFKKQTGISPKDFRKN